MNGSFRFHNLNSINMFLKFTIALLACTWGFSCAQDISGPEANPNAPAAEEAPREVPLPDGKTVPEFEPLDEHRIKIGHVIVNHKERTVSFQAQVNMKEGILEYVCCMPNGKLHESLLVTEADPLHISLGMTLLKFRRFEKFFPVRDENFEWLPFTEPKPEDYADAYVQIVMTYTENGREQKSDFSDIVVNNGGNVEKIDEWGKKRLAYPIQYINDGYYVLMNFEAEPTLPAELERNYKISDDVLRFMVINLDEK